MKFVTCALLMLSMAVSVSSLAQEVVAQPDSVELGTQDDAKEGDSDQFVVPQFDLTTSPEMSDRIRDLLLKHVTVFSYSEKRPAEKIDLAELRLLRFAVRRQIAGILATEGFFSPQIKFTTESGDSVDQQNQVRKMLVHVSVAPGPATYVADVQISFTGDTVPLEVQQLIRSTWSLKSGALFRDDDWSQAKNHAIETLNEHGYAAAKISESEALVQDQRANLSITFESGSLFRIGELQIKGLNSYGTWLLDSYHPPKKGDVYSQERLIKFQRALQNSPYFSTVEVSIDPDSEHAAAVPVHVLLQERKRYDLGLAAGYSTNTGMRGELSFQDRDFYFDAYNLKSVLRVEQKRQIGYADIFLPPKPEGYIDSVGVLFERTDIAGLVTQTSSFGAKRSITKNAIESRFGLSFVYEKSAIDGGTPTYSKAFVPSIGRTWRYIDNAFDPRHGRVTQVDIGAAAKMALSDQNFVRLYGKHQQWIPVGKSDVVILRAEGGYVIAPDDVGIPEDFLFRAGGTGSVRGYAYQSLGINEFYGVVGGRVMATASAEYVHWLAGNWGLAGFVDVGDAADRPLDIKMKQGIGLGVRYKSPAGPIAVDLAYGRQAHEVRLDFFLGIAF